MPDENMVSRQIQTEAGTVTTSTTTVDPFSQTITPVTGDELRELRSLTDSSLAFLRTYGDAGASPALQAYDTAFARWQAAESPSHTNEQVVELLGGILGNRCVDDLNMEWVTVTDKYGTDYAVRSREREAMAFPFSSVLKRIEKGENEFMAGVYESTKYTLALGDIKNRD